MRAYFSILIILILVICSLAVGDEKLTIYYTGNNNGIMRGCGCPASDYGGLENIASVFGIENYNALRINTGDLFSVQSDSLKDEYLRKIIGRFNFDVGLAGDKDFPENIERIGDIFPLVCANVDFPNVSTGDFLLIEKNGRRIVVTGLWSEETFNLLPKDFRDKCSLKSNEDSFNALLQSIHKQYDLLIVLTQGPEKFDRELLSKFNDIDILISGAIKKANIHPERVGDSYLIFTGENCESSGGITIDFDNDHKTFEIASMMVTPVFLHDPPPHPEIKALVDDYFRKWYQQLENDRAKMKSGKIFLGNRYCSKCHPGQYESWQNTMHAVAFRAIADSLQNRCIPCHTTGFGYPTGFWDIESTPRLAGIGCEECHYFDKRGYKEGPHPVDMIDEDTCVRCHHPPHDLNFDFSSYILKVLH